MNFSRIVLVAVLPFLLSAVPSPAKTQIVSKDPYLGAIAIDAESGKTIFESNADGKGYPASVLKLMDLLIVIEQIKAGKVSLADQVKVTADVSKIGGTQVWLAENEVFSVEDLLYALMIQSANDAAAALAAHVAGSREGFVALMNQRAKEIGMKNTKFTSVHGLPPGPSGDPDVTTARDLSLLCLEALKHPEIFTYTTARERSFRTNDPAHTVIMRTHNHLLNSVEGCDGFKTGFFSAAGFSICATAERKGVRIIAVVLGSKDRKVRDAKAAEMLQKGFLEIPPKLEPVKPTPPPPSAPVVEEEPAVDDEDAAEAAAAGEPACGTSCSWSSLALGIVIGLGIAGTFSLVSKLKRKREEDHHPRIGRSR